MFTDEYFKGAIISFSKDYRHGRLVSNLIVAEIRIGNVLAARTFGWTKKEALNRARAWIKRELKGDY